MFSTPTGGMAFHPRCKQLVSLLILTFDVRTINTWSDRTVQRRQIERSSGNDFRVPDGQTIMTEDVIDSFLLTPQSTRSR
jgi:hypothetical protein